ncbi:hypothetical protein [uncultured Gammaproteobacteria bacterium]|nr:hypothetical protein [uncultured Gammaproteobacteria bacterium]CAC9649607.1 hypothetical protein [uncultured Gammaproteobacteria bacterium]SHN94123.1 hypothetical protein BCLUESOX_1649 [bacterium endosymbiont of Bathymodiolus sp. 5 South]
MVLLKICVVESGVFWFSCFLNLVLDGWKNGWFWFVWSGF